MGKDKFHKFGKYELIKKENWNVESNDSAAMSYSIRNPMQ